MYMSDTFHPCHEENMTLVHTVYYSAFTGFNADVVCLSRPALISLKHCSSGLYHLYPNSPCLDNSTVQKRPDVDNIILYYPVHESVLFQGQQLLELCLLSLTL